MTARCTIETQSPPPQRDHVSESVRRTILLIPAVAIVMGAMAMTHGLRFGLLSAAVILGWTQLVGL